MEKQTLGFEERLVEIKTPNGVRTFRLQEHTCEQTDQWIMDNSVTYEQAREQLQVLQMDLKRNQDHFEDYYQNPDQPPPLFQFSMTEEQLEIVRQEIAEHSSNVLARCLLPADNLQPVDGKWVRDNLTRKTRERLIQIQNELNGLEEIKSDHGFLLERGILIAKIQISQAKKFFQTFQPPSSHLSESRNPTEQDGEGSL